MGALSRRSRSLRLPPETHGDTGRARCLKGPGGDVIEKTIKFRVRPASPSLWPRKTAHDPSNFTRGTSNRVGLVEICHGFRVF